MLQGVFLPSLCHEDVLRAVQPLLAVSQMPAYRAGSGTDGLGHHHGRHRRYPGRDLRERGTLRHLLAEACPGQQGQILQRLALRLATGQQLVQQATKGSHLYPFQPLGQHAFRAVVTRGRAKIAEQHPALPLQGVQYVMAIEIAMHDAPLMQMPRGSRYALRHGEHGGRGERQPCRIDVAGAGVQARRPRQIGKRWVYQRHHQRRHAGGVIRHPPQHPDEVGMGASRQRRRHLAVRQAIAGHGPLEQLDRHRLRFITLQSVASDAGSTVDHARGPLPQQLTQLKRQPRHCGDMSHMIHIDGPRLLPLTKGVAGIGEPGEAWQREQPVGEAFDPVGGDAQQFESMAIGQCLWQGGQAVARQHQLLQGLALTQLIGQLLDGVVGQDQPAQAHWQRRGGDCGNLVGLEAHHGECRAAPQHLGQLGETVLGAENDAQFGEPGQFVRQLTYLVAGEIQHLQRLFKAPDLGWELRQVFTKLQMAGAAQFTRAQLFQGMHNHFSILMTSLMA